MADTSKEKILKINTQGAEKNVKSLKTQIRELKEPAKRYDLVLYIRGEEQGVIHRVLHVRKEDYIIAGDNCWQKEYVRHEQVKGIAVRFYRNGKWYSVDHKGYRLYARLWTDFFFIRRPLFYLRDKAKRLYGKLRNKSR